MNQDEKWRVKLLEVSKFEGDFWTSAFFLNAEITKL